jgi:hypothetical protein
MEDAHSSPRPTGGSAIFGGLLGVALAVVTDLFPVAGAIVGLGLVVALISSVTAKPVDYKRLAFISGILIGGGLVYLYGVANTVSACQPTPDFCGHTVVFPLFALAVLLIVGGGILITISRRHSR